MACSLFVVSFATLQNNSKHASIILQNQGQAARGLLTVVLCFLFCNPDKIIAEDELFKKLHDKVDKRVRILFVAKRKTRGRGSNYNRCDRESRGLLVCIALGPKTFRGLLNAKSTSKFLTPSPGQI